MYVCRENKYIPPGQRNREAMSWGPGRQNSPRLGQSSAGPPTPRPGSHDYSPSSGSDQRVVNGGIFNMSPTNLLLLAANQTAFVRVKEWMSESLLWSNHDSK